MTDLLATVHKTIDDMQFHCTPFDALQAYPLVPRIALVIAPLLGTFGPIVSKLPGADLQAKIEGLLQQDIAALSPLLTALAMPLTDKVNARLPQELLAGMSVEVEGKKGMLHVGLDDESNINEHIPLLTMLKAMWWSIGVNFADFFPSDFVSTLTKVSAKSASPSD